MNLLAAYLASPVKGTCVTGTIGKETDWLFIAPFTISSGRLLIVDFGFLPSSQDGLVIELPSGDFDITARVMDYPGDRRISRLRLLAKGIDAPVGEAIGETWVDTAATSICDAEVMDAAWQSLGDDVATSRLEAFRETAAPCGVFVLDERLRASAPFVESGFGDGTYTVFELCADGRRVGIEIEFIENREPYPFGEPAPVSANKEGGKHSENAPWEDMAALFAKLTANKTGKAAEDRSEVKAALDGFLGELQAKAIAAAEEFVQRCTKLRERRTPLWIHVVPGESMWTAAPAVCERIASLKEAGFVEAGCFRIEEIPRFLVCGWVHPTRHVEALIEQHADGSIALFLEASLVDGSDLSVSDQPPKSKLPPPPWQIKRHCPGIPTASLIAEFFGMLTDNSTVPLPAEAFASRLEKAFHRVQHWRADRGGWSIPEIKAQRGLPDSAETTEELFMTRRDSADTWLFNWLRMQEALPFSPEAVLRNLVIVHDDLTVDLVANEWQVRTHDLKAKADLFVAGTPREAFARVNADRGNRLRLVFQKRTGLAADFYLPA